MMTPRACPLECQDLLRAPRESVRRGQRRCLQGSSPGGPPRLPARPKAAGPAARDGEPGPPQLGSGSRSWLGRSAQPRSSRLGGEDGRGHDASVRVVASTDMAGCAESLS